MMTFFISEKVSAVDRYVTVTGAGMKNGTDWANAYDKSVLSTTGDVLLNSTMVAGDRLYIGSGNYGSTSFTITTGGTATALKRIIGVDTGGGKPVFDSNNWSRTAPAAGFYHFIYFSDAGTGGCYWEFANMSMRSCNAAIFSTDVQQHPGLIFRDIDISNCRHGILLAQADNLLVERVSVKGYSKHAFRLEKGSDNVTFKNCVADMTNGDYTWWDYADPYPMGFNIYDGGSSNTNISFYDCVANNNRKNNQTPNSYWNGDGFSVEGNTGGTTVFVRCIANNNEDAGYDVKPKCQFTDCVGARNYRQFRFHNAVTSSMTNCVATFPFRRSDSNPTGSEGGSGVWSDKGIVSITYFTFHGNNGQAARVDSTGSLSLTNSTLSFTGATGDFTYGSGINFSSGTVTYRPGAGTNPNFENPSTTWNGIGTAMNSITYGSSKGYFIESPITSIYPEADTFVHDANPDSNYGTGTTMTVKDGSATYDRIAYMRFPVTAGPAANSATLKLTVSSIGGEGSGARTIEVRQLNNDTWSETGTTWNNRPSSTGTLIATINAGTPGQVYSIDVTSYVNQEKAGDGKAGFVLVQPANLNRAVLFGTRENPGRQPELELQ